MSKVKLTKKQNTLLNEIRQIISTIGLDYDNIGEYDQDGRSFILESMKNQIIRGEIIQSYTLVDEMLNNTICRYFFPGKRSFPSLWKTKHFQVFNYYIIEELYLLSKLRLVKNIKRVPKRLVQDIEALNSLRNAIAHSFFPENLRKAKPVWKGKNIFSYEGIIVFRKDIQNVIDYFVKMTPY